MQPHFRRLIAAGLHVASLVATASPVRPVSAQATGTVTGVICFDNDGGPVEHAPVDSTELVFTHY